MLEIALAGEEQSINSPLRASDENLKVAFIKIQNYPPSDSKISEVQEFFSSMGSSL